MKKTAVQKLIDHLEEMYALTDETIYEFKKALEEERDQIQNSFDKGWEAPFDVSGKQYYSETFKND